MCFTFPKLWFKVNFIKVEIMNSKIFKIFLLLVSGCLFSISAYLFYFSVSFMLYDPSQDHFIFNDSNVKTSAYYLAVVISMLAATLCSALGGQLAFKASKKLKPEIIIKL